MADAAAPFRRLPAETREQTRIFNISKGMWSAVSSEARPGETRDTGSALGCRPDVIRTFFSPPHHPDGQTGRRKTTRRVSPPARAHQRLCFRL